MEVQQRYLNFFLGNGNSKMSNNILPFSLMLHVAERLNTLIFLDDFR